MEDFKLEFERFIFFSLWVPSNLISKLQADRNKTVKDHVALSRQAKLQRKLAFATFRLLVPWNYG